MPLTVIAGKAEKAMGLNVQRCRTARRVLAMAALASLVPVVASSSPASAAGTTPLTTGLNADGQLGNGTTTSRSTPGPTTLSNIVQIASGREHAYALDDQGRVWAWGDNSKGAVGDGTTTDRPTPRIVLTGVAQIEAGHYHGIARKTDGTVWTWGYGALGQLGLGTTNNRTSPTQVPGINNAIGVSAGRDMSFILRAGGTVVGFGGNTAGEVGDGTITRRVSPVAVVGLTSIVEVVGGRNHAMALRSDGTLFSWGANEYGQVGDGTTTQRRTPVQVLTGVRSFDSGAEHSVAVLTNGTVRTWGRGWRGQLGLGSTATRTSPQQVTGVSGIVDVGDGRDQTFAMNAAGQVWAWGFNDTGQLGDGTTTQRNSPVLIAGLTGIVAAQGGRGMTVFLPASSTPPDPDVVPPSAPGKPVATSTVNGRADITWPAATDDRATTLTYRIYRDSNPTSIGQVVSSSANPSFADTGVAPGSEHTWSVEAFDGTNTGQRSQPSDPIVIFTDPPPDPDVLPPSAPGKPVATSTVNGRADITWPAATDDRATTLTYRIYRDDNPTSIGQVVSSSANPTFADTGLAPESQHTWSVEAFDGTNTGQRSQPSDPIVIAGPPSGPTVLAQSDFTNGLAGFTGVTGLTADNALGSPTNAPPSARAAVNNAVGTGQLALTTNATQSCTSIDVRVASISGTARVRAVQVAQRSRQLGGSCPDRLGPAADRARRRTRHQPQPHHQHGARPQCLEPDHALRVDRVGHIGAAVAEGERCGTRHVGDQHRDVTGGTRPGRRQRPAHGHRQLGRAGRHRRAHLTERRHGTTPCATIHGRWRGRRRRSTVVSVTRGRRAPTSSRRAVGPTARCGAPSRRPGCTVDAAGRPTGRSRR